MLPKYVRCVTAKGKKYYYFNTGKRVEGKRVYASLPSPRSAEFGGRYAALLGHRNRGHRSELVRVPKLIDLYQRSREYAKLSDASKKLYDIYLGKLGKLLPTAPVGEIVKGDMRKLFDSMGDKPSAANAFLSASGTLFSWGAERDYLSINPCVGIKKNDDGEHDPWPQPIVEAALASDDVTVRLLVHLLLYTGQRIGDVLAMSWGDIEGEFVRVKQSKTGKFLTIKMHKALRAELAVRKRDGIVICVHPNGRAINDASARYLLQKFAKKLGAHVVPHGLRKNAVNELLAAGCTVAQVAAITGQTLRMVEHYAKARDQQSLGEAAILRWEAKS